MRILALIMFSPEYRTLANPYSSTWNLKILEQYYNISCLSTGSNDILGMPVFKIRKMQKRNINKRITLGDDLDSPNDVS